MLNEWGTFAQLAGLIPAETTQPQAMAIIQAGKEMGLQPLQSLRSMSFIRGRLTMSVQLQLAMAKQKGVKIVEMEEEEGYCKVTLQKDEEHITCTYTIEDAKKAGLIRADGPYDKYRRQMLRWRAIGDCLRIISPDSIMGLLSPEEAESIEPFSVAPQIDKKDIKPIVSSPQTKTKPAPQTETETSKDSGKRIVTGIEKITASKGTNKKTGQEYTIYKVLGEGNIIYSTFDEKFVTLAKSAKEAGLKIELTHKKDKYNTITAIDIIEPETELVDDINIEPLPWDATDREIGA